MADKEATVYIVDVGLSMGEKHNRRRESDLEWAMHYVWDKITSTVLLRTIPQWLSSVLIDVGGYGEKDRYGWGCWSPNRWYEECHGMVVEAADVA